MSVVHEIVGRMSMEPDFAAKVKGAKTTDETIAIAKDAGVHLTAADIDQVKAEHGDSVSDEELESVTSGTPMAITLAVK